MKHELLDYAAAWQTSALVLFSILGLLVAWYVFSDRRTGHIARMAGMALDDDQRADVSPTATANSPTSQP